MSNFVGGVLIVQKKKPAGGGSLVPRPRFPTAAAGGLHHRYGSGK